MKVTSDNCKAWIVSNLCPASLPNDWRRRSKRKEGENIVRVFENVNVNRSVEVIEHNGNIVGGGKVGSRDARELAEPDEASKPMSIIEKLRANRITVSFLPVVPTDHHDISGRVIYCLGEEDIDDEDGIFFNCGPEDNDGDLHDSEDGGVADKLEKLFADLPEVDCGWTKTPGITVCEAENYHSVAQIPGVDPKDLWALVAERLERSGAVKMEE